MRMIHLIALRGGDPYLERLLEERLSEGILMEELDPDPFPGVPTEPLPGEIPVGAVLKRGQPICPYMMSLAEIHRGVGVWGMRGTGKTTLIFTILVFLMRRVPVLILDFKRDFRPLARLIPDLAVIRWNEFRYNLLELRRGIFINDLINRVVSAITCSHHQLTGSTSFLTRELGTFVRYWGEDRFIEVPPTIYEFAGWIRKRLVTRQYFADDRTLAARAVRTIQALREGTGKLFDVRKGADVEVLRDVNCALELDRMSSNQAELLATSVLAETYQLNMAQGRRQSDLGHVSVCDEAQTLFGADRERVPEEGLPLLFRLFVMSREIGGCGHILASQNPSKISQLVRSNLGTQFCFRLSDGDELATVQRGMMLYD
jgi:hypothetical protein